MQIRFFCVKRQAKDDFLKDVESTIAITLQIYCGNKLLVKMFNLSNRTLPQDEIRKLSMGLKFMSTPEKQNIQEMQNDFDEFHKKKKDRKNYSMKMIFRMINL